MSAYQPEIIVKKLTIENRMNESYRIKLTVLKTAAVILALMSISGCNRYFLWHIAPSHAFDAKKAPPAPDYALEENWAALPTTKDEADLVPQGAGSDNQATAVADTFYIHPTGYARSEKWNAPLEPNSGARELTRVMLAGQASAFNGCCRVYAPEYRQATLYSFLSKKKDAELALDLAYSDVVRAFDYYIKHYNNGRPFIIASHSQGTFHALRLLEERIDQTELHARLIGAYVIGYQAPLDKFERSYKRIKPCEGRDDVGCMAAWDTYEEGGGSSKGRRQWYASGYEFIDGKKILCTNPLNWQKDGADAAKSLNLGAMAPRYQGFFKTLLDNKSRGVKFESLDAPLVSFTGARCANGFLIVPKLGAPFEPLDKETKSHHLHDYSLFYMNIRQNAIERAAAMQSRK